MQLQTEPRMIAAPPQFVDDPTMRRVAQAADAAMDDVLAEEPLQHFLDDVLDHAA